MQDDVFLWVRVIVICIYQYSITPITQKLTFDLFITPTPSFFIFIFYFMYGSSTPERPPEDRAQGLESGNRNGLIAAGSWKGPNSKLILFPQTLCFQSTSFLRSTEYFKIHVWPLLFHHRHDFSNKNSENIYTIVA